ncbi:MAG: RIP metalloprotease RseP [Clostridiales bacterium]|jgi:regulator of sigma E protease|nr:RIP metalloprotease RseP [Clostridiales bacterium]
MSIVIAILVLSFLIIVHELGHFAAAKRLGVKVLEFSLFMGPRLLSFKRGETNYSLKLIPIGGACVMEGEEKASEDSRAYNQKPKWARAVICAAGPFMNLLTAFLLLLIINLTGGYATNAISFVGQGSAAALAPEPLAVGDVITKYAGKKVAVPSEVFIYLQDTKGAPVEVEFLRDGVVHKTRLTPEYTPGKRYVLGFSGAAANGPDWNLVAQVGEGDPADIIGIAPGDRILTVDGATPNSREELRAILEAAGGGEVAVTWQKADGSAASARVAPKLTNDQDSYSIGLAFTAVSAPGFLDGCRFAFHNAVAFSKMVLYSLKWMVTGSIGLNQVSGPVGIVAEIGAGVAETSRSEQGMSAVMAYLMNLTALIGINLGLFNLIPFPPLDGSKLLLLVVEAVRRKPIPPEREMAISMFGFAVLIAVMVLTLFNDIGRLVAK